jgi:hypothetical protein
MRYQVMNRAHSFFLCPAAMLYQDGDGWKRWWLSVGVTLGCRGEEALGYRKWSMVSHLEHDADVGRFDMQYILYIRCVGVLEARSISGVGIGMVVGG